MVSDILGPLWLSPPAASPSAVSPRSTTRPRGDRDRKSTRLNSSHSSTSYAACCVKKKTRRGRAPDSGETSGRTCTRASRSIFRGCGVRSPRSTLFPYTTLFRSLSYPLVNGVRHSWASVAITAGGLPFGGVTEINYAPKGRPRSEEHTSELQSQFHLVCRLLREKKNSSGPRTGFWRNERPYVYASQPVYFPWLRRAITAIYSLSLHDALPISVISLGEWCPTFLGLCGYHRRRSPLRRCHRDQLRAQGETEIGRAHV